MRSSRPFSWALPRSSRRCTAAVHPPKLDYQITTLSNGLRVILSEDHSTPIVHLSVWYHVGSRDEKPGRTGFAHLFEHMMFKGSKNVQPESHTSIIASYGGRSNAYTQEDATVFWETLPSQYLPLALWMEADRMATLRVDRDAFEKEREVVKEERRLRVDNQPYGRLNEILFDHAFTTHPYKHATIGSMKDLEAASLQDVRDFHDTYYVPENAVVTIVGDFDSAQATQLVQQYLGRVPKATRPVPRDIPKEPEQTQERAATGTLDPKPHRGGPPPALGPADLERLADLVREQPDATLEQLKQRGGFTCSLKTLWYRPRPPGPDPQEEEPARQPARPARRAEEAAVVPAGGASAIEPERLVFVDETGVTTAMTPAYARAPRGQRAVDSAPASWETVTVIAALGLDGVRAPLAFPGATDTAAFQTYVEQVLVPELHEGDVVVFDNLKPHLAAGVAESIEGAGRGCCRCRRTARTTPRSRRCSRRSSRSSVGPRPGEGRALRGRGRGAASK